MANTAQILNTGDGGGPNVGLIKINQKESRPGKLWKRFFASIIDSIIMSILQSPVYMFTLAPMLMDILKINKNDPQALMNLQQNYGTTMSGFGIYMVLGFLIQYFYLAFFNKKKGATPGKLIFGLRVVDSQSGTYLGFGQTFVREIIGKIFTGLAMIIFGLGFWIPLFRSDKKGLHDLIAGTQVIDQS